MTISPSSLAAGNLLSIENQQFAVSASVIPQKNVIIGSFDEATFVGIVPNVPIRVYSAADVGGKTGYGFMLHRLARAAFRPGNVETWIIPQLEGGSDPDQAHGHISFVGSAGVLAGTICAYIAGDRVTITVADADAADDIAVALAAAINAIDNLPVVATHPTPGIVDVTSKSGGTWGNDISLEMNLNAGESLPTGVVVTITPMAGGLGVPDIQDALDALGTGDAQNDKNFTNLIHGYGADTATLNTISIYNGIGNGYVGNYKKEIARPFRSLIGDVTPSTTGLTNALAFADLRRTDRTNGKLCAPGSPNHPQEIAAQALGLMAVINSTRAEEGYVDQALSEIYPGDLADRWTNDWDNRDQAVQGGISTSFCKNGVLTLQNLITFYRPTDVAPESNGYRAMRNISIIQNLLYNYRMNFERSKWKGITIVEDTAKVANVDSRKKARDVGDVIDDLLALADEFAGHAWIYTAKYTKSQLQQGDKVVLRAGLTGFDITFPVILSGEGGIYNSLIIFDTSIAVLLLGGE